ncbi:MAG: YbaK/EbsC family protein [Planctomycetota bacterium]|nr:YbaK/EbsC family protein [Planctomycetota bacterium]
MPQSILDRIRAFLSAAGVSFREIHHEPTKTSEESARVRGEPLRVGGKALLMKGDQQFSLFVLPADRRVDSAAIRSELKIKKLRFATPEELLELTEPIDGRGLVPGGVPPFGHPLLPFDLYLDRGLQENDRIAFNAGSLTDSIILGMDDYLSVAKPRSIFALSPVAND